MGPYKDFKGTINLDVRDSKADWRPFTPKKAPEGAPNILFVLYDDTGLAAWSPYGGRINMPTLDKLAQNGLTYTQWHTVALCSPTRSTLLTGRNHTLNGMAVTGALQRVSRPGPAVSRRRPQPSRRSSRTTATAPSGWARTTTFRSRCRLPRPAFHRKQRGTCLEAPRHRCGVAWVRLGVAGMAGAADFLPASGQVEPDQAVTLVLDAPHQAAPAVWSSNVAASR